MTTDGQQKFLSTLSTLSKDDRFCDVNIELSDGSQKFNRLLLAALSPFFDAMFSSSMKEDLSGIIKLPTVSSEVFNALTAYYIQGNGKIHEEVLYESVDASEMMQLPELKGLCIKKLSENLVPRNCVRVWQLSRRYSTDETLAEIAFQKIFENFELVLTLEDFLNLPREDVLTLLRQDRYIIAQKHALAAILGWLERNNPKEAHAVELFREIKLQLIEPVFILKNVYRDILKKYKAIEDVIKDHILHGISSMQKVGRWEHDFKEVIIVCSSSPEKVLVHAWDLRKKQWFDLSSNLSEPLIEFAAAVADFKIVLTGGRRDQNVSSVSYIYDTVTGRWSRGPGLLSPRCRHGSVSILDSVYIVGGCSEAVKQTAESIKYLSYSNAIEEWSPDRKTWETVGHLPTAVADASVVASGRYILAIAGDDESYYGTDQVQCFNVISKVSFVVHHIPEPAKFVRGAGVMQYVILLIEDKFYILTIQDNSEKLKVSSEMVNNKLPQSLTSGHAVVMKDDIPTIYTNLCTLELHFGESDLEIGTLPTVPIGGNIVECALRARIDNICYELQ